MLIKLVDLGILLFFPLIFLGIVNRTKAFWTGRKGPSIVQPIFDVLRLFKKGMVISDTTTNIFRIAPTINFVSIFFAGLLTPVINNTSIISFEGSFILFVYVLSLGKFFSLIAAIDTGSSFEGMGASREAGFSAIAEPALFIVITSIIALTGNYTFKNLSMILERAGVYGALIIALAVVSLFILMLFEGCRVPVDDPNTHLELTMIHEVMILDNSGFDLGLILYSSAMKMLIFASIIINLLIPSHISPALYFALYIISFAALAIVLGTLESATARIRMSHVFEFIFNSTALALVVLSLTVIKIYGV